ALESQLRGINAMAKIFRTTQAGLSADQVLDIHAFDLDHKLSIDDDFLEKELPFEWSGAYHLDAGPHQLVLEAGPDPVMGAVLVSLDAGGHGHSHSHSHDHEEDHEHDHGHHHSHGEESHDHDHESGEHCHGGLHDALHEAEEQAARLFSFPATPLRAGGELRVGVMHKLVLGEDRTAFKISIPAHGNYALFTQHGLGEFSGRLERDGRTIPPDHVHEHGGHAHSHTHDETVSSVGFEEARELDPRRVNAWLSELLQTKGQDIFRMKGILNLKNLPERFVFQGVHMLFEGKPDRAWKDASERKSQIVFIGRHLDREALQAGFRRCVA
ncbi:MAG: GTP-binding protein, partial [Verrucomicrobiae bacterium]|nr:GTP-binding protein [Verrucomicrobiae bacterium]